MPAPGLLPATAPLATHDAARLEELADLLRRALFRLNTRRFGTVTELIIKRWLALEKARSMFHDLYDTSAAERVEVKFSTVLARWSTPLREDTLEQVLKEALGDHRSLAFESWQGKACGAFDCNLQQVKPAEFDRLYYGLLFSDYALVFCCSSVDVPRMPGWSDKQHKGNHGEGQFHVTDRTLQHHLDHHLVAQLSYQDLARVLFAAA